MKSDQYLNLCLEQAAQSTLQYRHGCIVVKGGKVIGQGFNDCRPGYDGGSVLKTGVLPKSAVSSFDNDPDKPGLPKSKGNFKTVESVIGNCGGGHHANARLTMHSEMMAINSALSSRSTLAASAVSHVKPCYKLPSDSKRKRALRREAVVSYAQAVCLAAGEELQQGAGKAQADEWRFEPSTYGCNETMKKGGYYHYHDRHYYHAHQDKQNKDFKPQQYEHKGNRQKYNYKAKVKANGMPHDPATASYTTSIRDKSDSETVYDAQANMHRRADGSNASNLDLRKARNKQLIVPKGSTGSSSDRLRDRMKHPKLVGADVYVARLVNDTPPTQGRKQRRARKQKFVGSAGEPDVDACSIASNVSGATRSLHDELRCRESKPQASLAMSEDVEGRPMPAESRPCYRCVAYMHSAGIRRVFWTTNEGKWECAKIRDLIDKLEGTMQSGADTSLGLPVPDVFVTKHEVLLLRRLMGGQV
ncbi:hypothetical protein VPNG_03489 [Cytospora leucostoma]|uniref:CMP/dCMP-type deaminase domain-containing protein n=1 Tax=Cytospora leucostoma TaxID=1230097 RepID=A0A423XFV7_9PEZI|nr:hypothetical protein VPNG_03489 [Cytospora leucostoma]